MNDDANYSNFAPGGVPASSRGMVLQRGGEELILEKVLDCFTVRLIGELTPQQLSQVIGGFWHGSIPQADLEIFTVLPQQLESAMSQARGSKNVAFAGHVYRITSNPGTFVYLNDQVTVQFASGVDATTIEAIASKFGLVKHKPVLGVADTFVFLVSKEARENPLKITNQLQGLSAVLVAEPNILVKSELHYRPRDSMYPQQWYLHHNGGNQLVGGSHISAEQAWDITRGVRSVVVAVVDDSFDLQHPDLQGMGKIVAPRDLRNNDFLPIPGEKETSHGTACAGLAIAEENGTGIVGVAPGCALMPIRSTGFLDDQSIEDMFNWAIDQGASVISCSWGASAVYFPLSLRQRAVISRAATTGRNGKGCVVMFAAGNANRPLKGTVNERNWPDNLLQGNTEWLSGFPLHPDVIAVGACTSLNKKAAYSNWGTNIAVCAPSNNAAPGLSFQGRGFLNTQPAIASALPGKKILTIDQVGEAGFDVDNFTTNFGGTSSATPLVAGVAALILSANSNLTAQEVKSILEETADKIIDSDPDPQLGMQEGTYNSNGYSQWFGYGKVNAARAVQVAQKLAGSVLSANKYVRADNSRQVSIPDDNLQGITSAIAIRESSNIKDIQITVNITHDFLGDLEIYLIAPNNQRVLLQNRTLGCRTNLQTTYTIASHPALKQLLSLSARGNWQLWLIDYASQDVGKLNSWSLVIGH
ncbi:S8 family serine peptidase [Nodularia harveyana UHCC-0300]|uniref:S8 family serine peptidase n=1 Tax=Nodularia harveyana UHCC-0300 TaxID=2974287 RepID=A0ABU5UAQ9_9CYAN|nr:S8 family serine peptidase [Nodularia harveyana]MEA5580598.1 S8 family serine peptidase [Nodularia harveyana UHCC-0300]